MKLVKLEQADICIDCESIFNASRQTACPGCGSKAVYPVARWLQSTGNIESCRLVKTGTCDLVTKTNMELRSREVQAPWLI